MCSTTLVSSKQVFIGSRMPISPPCACCPFICGYMSHLYLSLSSTAVSVAVIIWLAGVAGTCGQCLCIVSGTGPLWGRLFPHCAPPWLGRSVCSCGLLECKPSVPLSNSPPTLIHDYVCFCACIINFFCAKNRCLHFLSRFMTLMINMLVVWLTEPHFLHIIYLI